MQTAIIPVGRSAEAFLAQRPFLIPLLTQREALPLPEAQPEQALETALMALFRDVGGREVFEALYAFTRGGLLGWITAFASSRLPGADPLEVLQDAYVNMYRYAKSFRDERAGSFRVWSRTVAGNLVRRATRERHRPRLVDIDATPKDPICPRRGPSEVLGDRERSTELARAWATFLLRYAAAFEELADRDRRALELIELAGRSYAEAAEELGVGLSNMKMIVFRARKRLRAALDIENPRKRGAEQRAVA